MAQAFRHVGKEVLLRLNLRQTLPICKTSIMQRKKRAVRHRKKRPAPGEQPVTLKALADSLGLAPTTVSLVLNASPVAASIPQETKDRIFGAAKALNYRPNFFARSLRSRRSYTIGVLVPEVSEGYAALVLSGIEDYLLQEGYFYFVVSHRHKPDLIDEYPKLLLERSIDGLIAVDTPFHEACRVPTVVVSGRLDAKGVTNITLDHQRAAELAFEHLAGLGHRQIALLKGQSFSADTEVRWNSMCRQAERAGIPVSTRLMAQLEGDTPSPEAGYVAAHKLLAAHVPFTALVAFNDVSAIGAIRALRETGLRVPEDVSVVGFDDIQSAAYQNPALTTVRQPLWQMGKMAAETVLKRAANGIHAPYPKTLVTEPELVVRESTCRVNPGVRRSGK
ncbi:MAG: LacI family DNA-binding transcriptional regulator [Terriglobia bacterium]